VDKDRDARIKVIEEKFAGKEKQTTVQMLLHYTTNVNYEISPALVQALLNRQDVYNKVHGPQ
jgi:hypothetical protein